MSEPRIAFVTAPALPHEDEDRPLIDSGLADRAVRGEWVAWDSATVDWRDYDLVVIRSTWDYHRRLDHFLEWCTRVECDTTLCNPGPAVRWNAHKRYLLDLERCGVPVVPTVLVESGEADGLGMILDARGWDDVVIKPAVSAGSFGTTRHRLDDPDGERALAALTAQGDALVQPFLDGVESRGETSLVIVAGTITHAVSKVPSPGEFRVQPQFGGGERPVEATTAERELATRALEAASSIVGPVLYARVDCVTVDGEPLLMELELIEPALYLPLGPPAAAVRFVDAVVELATR
ncbi:ATP-grasp domain-containing protein [Rhabdothermincola sp.]|uniref:ATP-grasp domain-containing protein n=1 Tax=Rhabdothermincola sp. TaxID=2820405 RepID=UPI002FDF5DDC